MLWNACVHRLDLGLYSHPKVFWWNGVRNHVNSEGKIPSNGGSVSEGSNPRRCVTQDSEPNTLRTELFRPLNKIIIIIIIILIIIIIIIKIIIIIIIITTTTTTTTTTKTIIIMMMIIIII